MAARAGGDGACAKLVSTYFDTPDRDLARRGLALRVRQSDGRFVQTVKSDEMGGGGPFVRGEWEDAIAGAAPDPAAPQSGRFIGKCAGRLAPLFRTEVARRTLTFAADPVTKIEAAIDRGRVVAADAAVGEAISEVELELKGGESAALYAVALDLLDIAPVRLERRSKAARGYELIAPEAAVVAAMHSGPIALDPAISGADALRRIGFACLDQIMQNEPAVLSGLAEGIHQMRVGIRRLRAALSAFGRMLPAEQRRWASGELRWLANTLGAARNLDVFETTLIAPADVSIGLGKDAAALRPAVDGRRKAAYIEAAKAVGSRRYTASMLRLLRWFAGGGRAAEGATPELAAPIEGSAASILDRRLRSARRRCKGFASQTPAERHRLRIALKKLRYAAEMLGGLYPAAELARFMKPLKRLQDDLGEANDVHVGHDIVGMLSRANGGDITVLLAGRSILGWHERRLEKRSVSVRRNIDRLLADEPFW